jgi:hypothetical protein
MWIATHEDSKGTRRIRLPFEYLRAALRAYVE